MGFCLQLADLQIRSHAFLRAGSSNHFDSDGTGTDDAQSERCDLFRDLEWNVANRVKRHPGQTGIANPRGDPSRPDHGMRQAREQPSTCVDERNTASSRSDITRRTSSSTQIGC